MKRRFATLAALALSLAAWSQEVVTTQVETTDDVYTATQQSNQTTVGNPDTAHPEMHTDNILAQEKKPLPITLYHTPSAWIPAPYRYGGMGHLWLPMAPLGGLSFWNLHEGFNASIDMGVSVGFGKNNPWRGAAFFTNVAGLYAHQVNDRLTLAGGLYLSHLDGWGQHPNALGLFGLANYRINDRLDITGYAAHDFGIMGISRSQLWGNPMQVCNPLLPGYGVPSTTVGADLGIRLGDNAKLNLGVSFTREQEERPLYTPGNNPTRRQMEDMHTRGRDW